MMQLASSNDDLYGLGQGAKANSKLLSSHGLPDVTLIAYRQVLNSYPSHCCLCLDTCNQAVVEASIVL